MNILRRLTFIPFFAFAGVWLALTFLPALLLIGVTWIITGHTGAVDGFCEKIVFGPVDWVGNNWLPRIPSHADTEEGGWD